MSATNNRDNRDENRQQSSRRQQPTRNSAYGNDGHRDDRDYYPDQTAQHQMTDRYDQYTEGQGGFRGERSQSDYDRDFEQPWRNAEHSRGSFERQNTGNPNYGQQGYGQQGYGQRGFGQQGFSGQGFGTPGFGNTGHAAQDYGGQTFGNQSFGNQDFYGSPGHQNSRRGGQPMGRGEFGDTTFDHSGSQSEIRERRRGSGSYGGGYDQSDYGSNSLGMTGRRDRRRPGESYAGMGPKGYKRTDERITEDINHRLTDHDEIDASDIDVKVKDGEVTLTGTICDRECRRQVEDVCESVSGVQDISNQLKVKKSRDNTNSSNEKSGATIVGGPNSTSKSGATT